MNTPLSLKRRRLIAASSLLGLASGCAILGRSSLEPQSMPFSLGVASGEPGPNSVLLWTRILPAEFDPTELPLADVQVRWELADDDQFVKIRRSGRVQALASDAHTVHLEIDGLDADRWYFYRFYCGNYTSPTGRTRTLPNAPGERLRFAVASCQHYEAGFYAAHRHLAAESVDLVWFVGDYIYEYGPPPADVPRLRRHDTPGCVTLNDYRRRYSLYKRDPDLQLMHASAPFLPIWDDHEVDNDYAGSLSRDHHPEFPARRAAAYRAYLEHMPIRMPRMAADGSVTLYRTVDYGSLVRFHALDDRQYRDEQACSPAGHGAGYVALNECEERLSPNRSMLGGTQEKWLASSLSGSRAKWNVITQQTLMAQAQIGGKVWVDGWDGYPAARAKLLTAIADLKVANPIVVGGDVHATYVSDLRIDPQRDDTPVVAREFCGTSISTPSWPQSASDRLVRENPAIRYARSDRRGYLLFDLTPRHLQVTMRALNNVRDKNSSIESLIKFDVEANS